VRPQLQRLIPMLELVKAQAVPAETHPPARRCALSGAWAVPSSFGGLKRVADTRQATAASAAADGIGIAVQSGEVVAAQGAACDRLYIVIDGHARLVRSAHAFFDAWRCHAGRCNADCFRQPPLIGRR
jgi:hypothetical protein